MTLDISRRCSVEIAVADLIEDYGIVHYPLDVSALIARMGISISGYEDLPSSVRPIAESLSRDAFSTNNASFTKPRVYVRQSVRPFSRIAFSLAHELGHIWLEHGEGGALAEEEADYFGGYLLAPHPFILINHMNPCDVVKAFALGGWSAEIACRQADERRRCGPRNWAEHERRLLDGAVLDSMEPSVRRASFTTVRGGISEVGLV